MRYKMIMRDAIVFTDDYEDYEIDLLKRNLQIDMRRHGVNYPVSVLNEHNKKVFTLVPMR